MFDAFTHRPQASVPLYLFAAGESGAWFDPSDIATLFQDDAGTIPVTAADQPVGLMLDKSGNGNNATQVSPALRPFLRFVGGLLYLEFNGVDSFMVTSVIDLSATNQLTVFAGVSKDSDTATALVCETGGGGSRSFSLFAPPDPGADSFGFRIWGALGVTVKASGYAAPITAVLTGYGDTPSGVTYLRVDGALPVLSEVHPNSGGIGNSAMFIGMRNGNVMPLLGGLYGLIIRGAATSPGQVADVERYMASKTGVTLAP